MAKKHICPGYTHFLNPTLKAIDELGGSGTNGEIHDKIVEDLKLSDEVVDEMHPSSTVMTELEYQLAWARTYLKIGGYLESGKRSVWSLSTMGKEAVLEGGVDSKALVKKVNKATAAKRKKGKESSDAEAEEQFSKTERQTWKERLGEILHAMDPFAFERLTQYLLRECGFNDVRVTKKSGDGGIDGTATLKLEGIFSFHVAFQCKRYQGVVGAEIVRNFRGSLDQNIEKGVLITTGRFSKSAVEEAIAPSKKQIDLMDGNEFMNKLAECGIGLEERKDYVVDEKFYADWK